MTAASRLRYQHKHWHKLRYFSGKLILHEEKHEELWSFYLSLPANPCKIAGKIYLENEITIIEGEITYTPDILSLLISVTILSAIIIFLLFVGRYEAILLGIAPLVAFFSIYNYKTSSKKFEEVIRFWDGVVNQEDSVIEREWERLYGKTKNDEAPPEILKEKRK